MRERRCVLAAGLVAAVLASSAPVRGEQVIQLTVDGLLDGRPVATLTGGAIVPWTTGLDRDDGFMTMAAAASLHQTGPALPDDGSFAANAEHPEVRLHFSNAAAATSPQAHLVTAAGSLELAVPSATYATIFLFLTSSYGDAPLSIKMTYADQTTTTTTFTLPDWGTGAALPKGPPRFFNLISGLHKWSKAGASLDTPSHTITGVALTPAPDRALATVEITKTTAMPWLTFWGATAIATSALGGGADGGDASAAHDGADGDAPAATDGGATSGDAASDVVEAAATGGQAGDEAGASASAGASGASGAGGATPVATGAADASAAPLARPSGGCALGNARSAPLASTFVALTFACPWWRRRRRATMTSHENVAGSRDRPRLRVRLRRHERAEER